MMTQEDLVVVGIDVAKDKIDACIRTVTERKTCPTTAAGRRSLIAWLRKHRVGKAVMEASGGYERVWAKALRQAGLEVRIVDPNGFAILRNRLDALRKTTRSTRR
jgi:transposase